MKTLFFTMLFVSLKVYSLSLASETPSEFSVLKNRFDSVYKTKTNTLFEVYYSKVSTLGFCTEDNHIQVNLFHWRKLSQLDKVWLVFHELGHCVLGLDHNTELNSLGYPKSIMYPIMFSMLKHYKQNHDEYINQMRYENAKQNNDTNTDKYSDYIRVLIQREQTR